MYHYSSRKRHLTSRRKQQFGLSLPLIAISIAVFALVIAGFGPKIVRAAIAIAGESFGTSVNTVAVATDNYRSIYVNVLTTPAPVIAGFANPMAPTVAELKAKGLLNVAVADTLPDGNTYNIRIIKQPAGCIGPSTTCNVYSIIYLTEPIVDDNGNPSITRLGALTSAVKSPSSASYATLPDTTLIKGGNGAWSIPNPDSAQRPGIVTVVGGLGGSGTLYLTVFDPRDPFFGTSMTTTTYLKASNGIGETAVAGTACVDPTGAIRNDVAGRLLTCQSGFWRSTDGSKVIMYKPPQPGVVGGATFPVDTCPASSPAATAWATFVAETSATNMTVIPPYQVVNYSVTQVGGNWVTLTTATRPPAAPVTVNGNSAILGVVPTGTFSSGCSLP